MTDNNEVTRSTPAEGLRSFVGTGHSPYTLRMINVCLRLIYCRSGTDTFCNSLMAPS